MFLQRWRKEGSRELPQNIRRSLVSQFRADAFEIINLRYMEKTSRYTGRRVRYIRIFDRTLIPSNGDKAPRIYHDLDQHEDAILFEGYIEKDGTVHLWDRRSREQSPKKAAPSAG